MLTIEPSSSTQNKAIITVTPDMTPEDRGRLASLANVLSGHKDGETYVFTEKRGRKAWLLYRHGFSGVATLRRSYTNERSITHPKYNKCFQLSNAVTIAKLMEPAEVEAEQMG